MIELSRICKSYSLPRGNRKDVLRDASITFRPGVNMGILGLNGQGKSTLIRIISGSELPDSGTIKRKGRVSWPIGFTGGFNGSLTGRENLRFTVSTGLTFEKLRILWKLLRNWDHTWICR